MRSYVEIQDGAHKSGHRIIFDRSWWRSKLLMLRKAGIDLPVQVTQGGSKDANSFGAAAPTDQHQAMNTIFPPIFEPPKPSRAERHFLRKTPNHFVGETTFGEDLGQGQTLGFGSKLEHDIALVTIYTPGVVDVREQVEVRFVKANGKTAPHYIDYVSYERSGRRTGILVKKQSYADRVDFQDTACRVALAAIPLVVDRVVIATEQVLERNLMARVEQFHGYRFAQPDIDQKLAEALPQLEGPSSIRSFLEMAGLGTAGFHGVVRMVRFQKLAAPVPGLLSMSSFVQPWSVTE